MWHVILPGCRIFCIKGTFFLFEGNKDFTVTPDCFHAFATAGRGTEGSREVLRDTIAFFEKYKTQD